MSSQRISRPVCILGLGLIGGSLLRDLVAAGETAYGYNRSPDAVEEAKKEGFDVTSSISDVLSRAQGDDALVVVATPMGAVGAMLDAIAEFAPDCGFTDVVSVKGAVLEAVRERGMAERYVGSHPMAGTAECGWAASHEGLFRGAAWVIGFDLACGDAGAGAGAGASGASGARAGAGAAGAGAAEVPASWVELWKDVATLAGVVHAEVVPARVGVHDAAVARISHMPHVLAEALAVVGDQGGALAHSLAAGSFRDATRVAGSEPALVRAMCETNAAAVVDVLDEVIDLLNEARESLSRPEPDIAELADAGHSARIRFKAREASGARGGESVSPVPVSSRPVLRVRPGEGEWVQVLIQAESLGARVEVF